MLSRRLEEWIERMAWVAAGTYVDRYDDALEPAETPYPQEAWRLVLFASDNFDGEIEELEAAEQDAAWRLFRDRLIQHVPRQRITKHKREAKQKRQAKLRREAKKKEEAPP